MNTMNGARLIEPSRAGTEHDEVTFGVGIVTNDAIT